MAFNEQLNTKEDGLKEYMKIPFKNESNCSISIAHFSPYFLCKQTIDNSLEKIFREINFTENWQKTLKT